MASVARASATRSHSRTTCVCTTALAWGPRGRSRCRQSETRVGLGGGEDRTEVGAGRARVPEDQPSCPTVLSAPPRPLPHLLLEIGTGIALQTGYSKGWTGVPQYCPTLVDSPAHLIGWTQWPGKVPEGQQGGRNRLDMPRTS